MRTFVLVFCAGAVASLCVVTSGCASLTPAEDQAIAKAIEAGFDDACPFELLLPGGVGAVAVEFCPAEEAAVNAAVNAALAAETPTARAQRLNFIGPVQLAPLYATRSRTITYNGHTFAVALRTPIGRCPASLQKAAQAYIDAHPTVGAADGGAPQ